MKNKVLKAVIAFILIIVMTMADFMLVGMNLVTYALSNVDNLTNNENVRFSAYFKTEEKNKVSQAEYQIDNNQMKLYLEVSVKNDGYFDGVVTLKDANFKLKEEILSDNVSNIEGNEITLNRIRAGSSEIIEVGIEPIIEENYKEEMLCKESTLSLAGKYFDSTQESSEQYTSIEADKKVELTLLSPSNLETILETEVITNKIYTIENLKTRLVQVELNSSVVNNAYPIKRTVFEVELPESAELVEVISKGTYATNGKSEQLLKSNEDYKLNENILTITIENTSETKTWKKDATDSIIVTLKIDEKVEVGTSDYNLKSKVEFQGTENKLIEKEIKYNLAKESDGIIRTSIENKEEIYKGKIYSGEEKEYQSTTNIEVNYANIVESTTLEEKATYRTEIESADLVANIQYKTTILNKTELEKVLGTQGSLTIKSGSQEKIITSTVVTDKEKNITVTEDGKIIITHEEGVKDLQVIVTKASQTGIIRLNHTKVIKADNFSKEEITEKLNYLVDQAKIKYDVTEYDFEAVIDLKETTTVAEFAVDKQVLSTMAVNEDVKMTVTLNTENEKYDLYKNPTITIKLPEGIKKVTNVEATLLYLSNFTLNTSYDSETREIQIKLLGDQIQYNLDNTNGYIEILADIELDETVPNRQDVITMNLTNEKAVNYQNNGESKASINISGPSGLVAFNEITSYDLKTNSVTSKDEQIGYLKMYEDATEANFEITLVNNSGEDLKDVKILGNLPVEGQITLGKYTFENTIPATLKTGIIAENATIYYTENKTATNDLADVENGWNTNLSEVINPVLYMIVISNIEKGTNYTASYTMNIPANLEYDKDMKTTYLVEYSTNVSDVTINAIPIGLETGKVFVTLDAMVGTEEINDNNVIRAGEVIKYKATINNRGSNLAENVKITGLVPEGTVYVKPVEDYAHAGEIYYEELENTIVEKTIEKLSADEKITFEYEVRVKNDTTVGIAKNQITVLYNNDIEVKSNIISTNLAEGEIRVTVKRVAKTDKLVPGNVGQYFAIVENISNTEQTNINVKFDMPDEIIQLQAIQEINGDVLETKNEWNIESLGAGDYRIYQLFLKVNEIQDNTVSLQINCTATTNERTYRSNLYTETLYGIDVEIKMTSSNEGEYVKTDDIIEYQIEIINKSQVPVTMMLVDKIPEQLSIQAIEIDGQKIDEISGNSIYITLEISEETTKNIRISTIVKDDITRLENQTIINVVELLSGGEKFVSSEEIRHIVEAVKIQDGETQNPSESDPNQPEVPGETTTNKYSISGKVWVDQDKDGEMNNTDTILKTIQVRLLNAKTNEFLRNSENNKDLIAETSEDGYYAFEDIEEGKYIVVFEYDTTLYKPTTYQKAEVSESRNSNAISKVLIVNGEEQQYAATNEIILNRNVANINMGLVFVKQFDIQVDKYVSKVIVQDSKETKTYNYNNEDFAKVEINAKRMIGSTILVQYTIKLTNIGDVDAYVNSIVDYAPDGLKFNSELNTEWYEIGKDLYTNSLGTTAIAPGESKEISLILTKAKTDGNAELINNMAEISEAYNIYGIQDINSEQHNENKDENDLGSADLMISIQTGTVFNYIALVISMLTVIGAAAYIINKKVIRIRF